MNRSNLHKEVLGIFLGITGVLSAPFALVYLLHLWSCLNGRTQCDRELLGPGMFISIAVAVGGLVLGISFSSYIRYWIKWMWPLLLIYLGVILFQVIPMTLSVIEK